MKINLTFTIMPPSVWPASSTQKALQSVYTININDIIIIIVSLFLIFYLVQPPLCHWNLRNANIMSFMLQNFEWFSHPQKMLFWIYLTTLDPDLGFNSTLFTAQQSLLTMRPRKKSCVFPTTNKQRTSFMFPSIYLHLFWNNILLHISFCASPSRIVWFQFNYYNLIFVLLKSSM